MIRDSFNQIQKEFFALTRIFLGRRVTNDPRENSLRKDHLFNLLAEKVFDKPEILKALKKKIGDWLSGDCSETILALAAYIYYLDCDFNKAKKYFMKALEKNPGNLDNWLDLAFCLNHCYPEIDDLGKAIIFNFDIFIEDFKKNNYEKCNIGILKELNKKIRKRKLDYAHTFNKFTEGQALELCLKKTEGKKKAAKRRQRC